LVWKPTNLGFPPRQCPKRTGFGTRKESPARRCWYWQYRDLGRHQGDKTMTKHATATREEWLAARTELLVREKEHTRLGDDSTRQRRELPWVQLDKEYRFDTESGVRTLAELFDGRSQLIVYHFMFGPNYEAGCVTCSSTADSFNGVVPHLAARDVTL